MRKKLQWMNEFNQLKSIFNTVGMQVLVHWLVDICWFSAKICGLSDIEIRKLNQIRVLLEKLELQIIETTAEIDNQTSGLE